MKNNIYSVLTISAIVLSAVFLVPSLQLSAPVVNAQSAFNSYMTIDGVQGSSTHTKDGIDVLSWSWGANQTSSIGSQSSGAGAGKANMQDFSFTKRIDKSSPVLYSLYQSGKSAKNVTLTVSNGSSTPLKIQLTDATVSGYGLSSGGDRPSESITLNFSKISFSYDLAQAKK